MNFYFPIQPKNGNNTIQASVYYHKDRKQVLLRIYPAKNDNGLVIAEVTQGNYAKLEDMNRLNRKRVEELTRIAKESIEKKVPSIAYDTFCDFIKEKGYTLA